MSIVKSPSHQALMTPVRLVTKCAQTKKIFQTGHQYHSSRMYSALVNLIKDGKVGKITSIESQWNRNGDWRKPVPDQKLEHQINWRMYREYSYGLLAELSSHQIDFANWIIKRNTQKNIGFGGIDYWKDGRETYDNIKKGKYTVSKLKKRYQDAWKATGLW